MAILIQANIIKKRNTYVSVFQIKMSNSKGLGMPLWGMLLRGMPLFEGASLKDAFVECL